MITSKEWNEKYPTGTMVIYHAIIGGRSEHDIITSTRSRAWNLPSGADVVQVHRKAGCVSLEALDIFKAKDIWWTTPEEVNRSYFTDKEVCGGETFIIRKARKDHTCSLCFDKIHSGSDYIFKKITPWDHPDNESYFDFKAHGDCYGKWRIVGKDNSWVFPNDKSEWKEMIGDWAA